MSSSKDAIPASSKGSWSSFLKSIASFNGDLSSLTAPPFILSSTSLTEYSAYWAEHPNLFVAPATEADPEKRALAVLKWFISTLHQQYCTRSEKLGSEKKPLNPFLGELFLGKWNTDENVGETSLISEQVSTIQIKQIGHALLTVTPPNADKNDPAQKEQYLITLPSLHIESLIYGTPFVELEKTTRIVSSTGYVAKIDYSGKGWLSGKKNTFNAILYKESEGEKKPLYTVDGQWSDKFTIKNARTKDEVETYVVKDNKTTPLQLAPLEDQDLYESRRAWQDVASGIERGDMDAVSVAKSKIENAQRELRRVEKSEGREWERRFFNRVDENEDQGLLQLARKAGLTSLESDKTGGVWRFNPASADGAKPPYHKTGGEGLGVSA
ncbi:unnamed protein product [Aspergillus oryzae]|uniref:Unnamed protein product n=2 Tax=Aspergillus oryzae TaxID=5062 RepID=A0AAN5C4A7_ASPOZ|nr:unnamed protein product [Aspergillus oryzae]GMF85571.1 unnamed protein product [Aspergillus oryzae]GMG14129.1 unnamed protein product [Aspergillus oryzae]GMG37345.1 unnamed protein product [Aspergillus oryzae]GMG54850.1 unnamed protein product [Aspergillus oryzae var. brunneus]